MALSKEGFMAYGRLSPASCAEDNEDFVADLCFQAAIDHAKSFGVPVDRLISEDNAKFELYIYALALHFYDNRGMVSPEITAASDKYTDRLMTRFKIELEAEGWIGADI